MTVCELLEHVGCADGTWIGRLRGRGEEAGNSRRSRHHWRSVMDRAWPGFAGVSSGSGDVAWLLLRGGAGFALADPLRSVRSACGVRAGVCGAPGTGLAGRGRGVPGMPG